MEGFKTAAGMVIGLAAGVATLAGFELTGQDQGALLAVAVAVYGLWARHVTTGKAGWRK